MTLAITAENGEDQLIDHKCLVLRPDLKLDIILLGEDFLLNNDVEMKYDKKTLSKQFKINGIRVVLLAEAITCNLMTFPASFLTTTNMTKDPSIVPTSNLSSQEFFRLDPVPIDDLQINSFLQECDLAKTKYFQNQEIQSSSFSVQPKTLDDIIQGDFEK